MSRRLLLLLVVLLATTACSRLGTGLPACRTPASNPTGATVLSLQALPESEYSPCLNALPVGWEEVEFEVESGLVYLEFERNLDTFLEVSLTESCDIGDAVEVPSGMDGITRYEDVVAITDEIKVTIIPDGERTRIYAKGLAAQLDDLVVEDRPVRFLVDEDIDDSVRSRVNEAFFTDQFVWILNDLDIDEETLEMRATPAGEGKRGISVDDAVELIEDMTDEVQYSGEWYFVFDGGCITYEFDAEGALASSVAEDAEATIGFYSSADLRRAGRQAGYEIVDE